MKARRVKHLDPDGALADELEKFILVRLDELCAFMPTAADPEEVEALHDMRIAAKRLRYLLELSEGLFGPYAATAAKRAKDLQDLIGEIHDCDVTLPRIEALDERLREEDIAAVHAAAGDAADLEASLVPTAPHAAAHRGLATYQTYLHARRRLLFDRFGELWRDLQREGFEPRLRFAVSERPDLEPEPVTP